MAVRDFLPEALSFCPACGEPSLTWLRKLRMHGCAKCFSTFEAIRGNALEAIGGKTE